MAEPKQPRRWVEFYLEPYPAADPLTDTVTYRWSTRPLGGLQFIEGRVAVDGFASITRRASSASGEPHIDSATLILDDTDGQLRELLADSTTQWFRNRESAFKLLSAVAFAAGLTPRILFGGRCYDAQALDGRKASMEFEDLLAPYMDRTYPQYTLGHAYPFAFAARPDTPVAGVTLSAAVQAQPHAAPTLAASAASGGSGGSGGTFYYAIATVHAGVLSELSNVVTVVVTAGQKVALTWSGLAVGADEVRVFRGNDAAFGQFDRYRVTGNPYVISDVDAAQSGVDDLYPGIDTRDQLAPDPNWDLVYRQTLYYYLSVIYSDGSESLCSAPVTVALYPRNKPLTVQLSYTGTPTPVTGLTVTGLRLRRETQSYHFPPALDREWDLLTGDFPFDDDTTDTTAASICAQGGPTFNVPAELRDQVIPIYYGPHIDSAVDPITGVQRQKGLLPTFHMGFTQLSAGVGTPPAPSADMAALLGANINDWGELVIGLGEMDIPNVYASDLADPPHRVLLDESRFGIDVLAPGHTGWPLATDYVIRNGYRVTVIYARWPVLWHHIAGLVNITVDGCGWKNSDGDAIDQAGFVYQDFLTQHVLAHDGAGYTSGPPIGLPLYADGRAMFWTSKIQDWQTLTADRLNTAKGYLASMALTEPITLREWFRIFHLTFDAFSAKNAAGQLYLFSIDDLADPTDGVPIRERIELRSLPAPKIGWTEVENWVDYTVGWDPEQKRPRTTTKTLKSTWSITAMKEICRYPGVLNLKFTADDATALDALGRRQSRLKQPPRYQGLPVNTGGVDREIGEQVLVSHQDGLGPMGVGYSDTPMVLLEHLHQGNEILLSAFEMSRLLSAASRWASDLIAAWDSASAADQALYGFWATDDDTVGAANEPAPEWR